MKGGVLRGVQMGRERGGSDERKEEEVRGRIGRVQIEAYSAVYFGCNAAFETQYC